jgi:hypothetical protein
MADSKYTITRRILVRKIGFRAGAVVKRLVSGPCKARTAAEQSASIAKAASSLNALAKELASLDTLAAS